MIKFSYILDSQQGSEFNFARIRFTIKNEAIISISRPWVPQNKK
jgi:hypothetical protein